MSKSRRDEELAEIHRRAQEARESWKRAKDDLKEALKRARAERRRSETDEAHREEVDETIEEISETAREFAREIGDEARRLAEDLWRGARKEWHGRWREQWESSFGKDWQGHWVFGGRRFRHWTSGAEEANPFVAAILSRGGGLLALYVLHLLAEQPRHGNDVMRQIEQRTMGSWTSNPGAIYPLLSSMEENGLVGSRWEDPDKRTRRIYQITDEGRQELGRLRRVLRPKVMEAIEVLHVLYDDLYGDEEYQESGDGSTASEGEPGSAGTATPEATETPAGPTAESRAEPSPTDEAQRRWRTRFGRFFRRDDEQAMAYGD